MRFFLVLMLVTASVFFGGCRSLEDRQKESDAWCAKFHYGQAVESDIGRKGTIVKCGNILPNPIYGYVCEVRWNDDPNGEFGWFDNESLGKKYILKGESK